MPHGGKRPGAGRKAGVRKQRTEGVAVFARSIVEDPTYQAQLLLRAQRGGLPPPVETMLYGYAYGKPAERQASRDDVVFLEQLLAVVLKHVGSREVRQEIRAIIDTHLGGDGLRVVA